MVEEEHRSTTRAPERVEEPRGYGAFASLKSMAATTRDSVPPLSQTFSARRTRILVRLFALPAHTLLPHSIYSTCPYPPSRPMHHHHRRAIPSQRANSFKKPVWCGVSVTRTWRGPDQVGNRFGNSPATPRAARRFHHIRGSIGFLTDSRRRARAERCGATRTRHGGPRGQTLLRALLLLYTPINLSSTPTLPIYAYRAPFLCVAHTPFLTPGALHLHGTALGDSCRHALPHTTCPHTYSKPRIIAPATRNLRARASGSSPRVTARHRAATPLVCTRTIEPRRMNRLAGRAVAGRRHPR